MQLANYDVLQNYNIDTKNIYQKNTNRPVIYGISIDNNTALYFDDGISLVRKNGNYILQISITDITECIPFRSSLDIYARKKLFDDKNNFIFPLKVKDNCLSLKKDRVTLAFTVEIMLNSKLEVLNIRFFESAFVNKQNYSYRAFDKELEKKAHSQDQQAIKLSLFAEKLYKKENDEDKKLNANQILECIMTFTNKQVASFCAKNNIPVIYHNKMPRCDNKYTLEKTGYTTFTSSMRKYTDIITHRQIKKYLGLKFDCYCYNQKSLQNIVNELNALNCIENNNNYGRLLIENLIRTNSSINKEIIEKLIPTLEREKVDPFVVFYIIYYLNSDKTVKDILIKYFRPKINKSWGRALFAFIKYSTNLRIELDIGVKRNSKRYKDKKSDNRNSTIYLEIGNEIFEFTQKRKKNEQLSSKAMEMLFTKLYKYIHDNKINIFENI